MTITCPDRLYEAARKAEDADKALERAIRMAELAGDDQAKQKLVQRRGQATRTLMWCLASRAKSDSVDKDYTVFRSTSEIVLPDGSRVSPDGLDKESLPVKETVIYSDIAPYSFFFTEEYVTPHTRRPVTVYDKCWYITKDDEAAQKLYASDDREVLAGMVFDGRASVIWVEEEFKKEMADHPERKYREFMVKRVGMNGGIIYHPDYTENGTKQCDYGSWSTHT